MCFCELKLSLIVKASSNKGKFLALSLRYFHHQMETKHEWSWHLARHCVYGAVHTWCSRTSTWVLALLCSDLEYPICYCVHHYSPLPCHFEKLAGILVKFSGLPRNLQSRCVHRVPVPNHFSARVQGLLIVVRHRHYTQIRAWVLHKEKGHIVHISARAQALCLATECERVLKKKSSFSE